MSDAQFRATVLNSKSWADYLAQPAIPPFDEAAVLAEIAQRNAVRAGSNLPLLDVRREVARLRKAYESPRFSERFYELAYRAVREIFGPVEPSDFKSMSGMAAFFASRQNVIRDLIQKQIGSGSRR